MSRAGEEMVLELASLLETDFIKSAAKKDDEKDDKKDDEKDEKEDKKDDKKKDDKKASVMIHVLRDLVKLAGDLDDLGAEEASGLVDEALRVITKSIETE